MLLLKELLERRQLLRRRRSYRLLIGRHEWSLSSNVDGQTHLLRQASPANPQPDMMPAPLNPFRC